MLIVDDNETVRLLARQVLVRQGYDVCEAVTGEEGTTALEERHLDAVIVDVKLPDGHGYDFIQSWKSMGHAGPFIVISGYARNDVVPQDDQSVTFLSKPFRPSELVGAIDQVLT